MRSTDEMRIAWLTGVRSWAVYYGAIRKPSLSEFDLAVVAPEAWDTPSLQPLQAGGTLVLAYISVLEVPVRVDSPPPPHVLVAGGKPVEHTRWGNWVLDPRETETLNRLRQICSDLAAQGYDGFFLDTMGDMESIHLPVPLRARLLPATARLVADVRRRHPGLLLVQNWGLGALLDLTAQYMDGVCWEDFPDGPPQPWQRDLSERLLKFARGGLQVLALSHQGSGGYPAWARELGFPWYGAPGTYIELGRRAEP